jgi:hypothetical protein
MSNIPQVPSVFESSIEPDSPETAVIVFKKWLLAECALQKSGFSTLQDGWRLLVETLSTLKSKSGELDPYFFATVDDGFNKTEFLEVCSELKVPINAGSFPKRT